MYNLKKGVSICIFYGDLLERYVDIGKKRKTTPLFSVPFALEGYDTIIVYYICMRKLRSLFSRSYQLSQKDRLLENQK